MKTLIAFTGLVGRGVGSHLYIEAVLSSATPVISLSLAVIFWGIIYLTKRVYVIIFFFGQ